MRPIWFAITADPEHSVRATTAALEAARPHARRVEARLGADAPPQVQEAWQVLRAAWTGPVGRVLDRTLGALRGRAHRGAVRFPAADDAAWAALLGLVPWVTVDLVGDAQAEVARTAEAGRTCVARLTAEEGAALRELLTAGDADAGVTVEQLGANRTWYDLGGTA